MDNIDLDEIINGLLDELAEIQENAEKGLMPDKATADALAQLFRMLNEKG